MKLMTIKEYAISHKLSIYNVVKMTKNGNLQTKVQKLDGKDEIFIMVDETSKLEDTSQSFTEESKIGDFEKAYFKLKIKYNQLQKKYENLQKKI